MNKCIAVGIVVILMVVSFIAGNSLKKSNDNASELSSLQSQIDKLNSDLAKSNQELLQLKSANAENYFVYTHKDGKQYNVSVKGFSFPLTNVSRCELLNRANRAAGGVYDLDCVNDLEMLESRVVKSNTFNYTVYHAGCSGFVIDEQKKTINYWEMCTTN